MMHGYHASGSGAFFLLPLWEKGGLAKRGRMRGSLSADADPSSGTDFVRATFSHKGRRQERAAP
jgi:hypothetical protein